MTGNSAVPFSFGKSCVKSCVKPCESPCEARHEKNWEIRRLLNSQGKGLFIFVLMLWLPLAVQADFGAYIQVPGNEAWVPLSSYSWDIPVDPEFANKPVPLDENSIRNRKKAPEQGPAVLIITKPVNTAIEGLSGHCGAPLVLPVVHLETPVWDTRFPTNDVYFQHYVLQQVTLQNCLHSEGAPADAFLLEFAGIVKEGEPRPRTE